jgi:DNA-binding CsgD family transcriptional regulator
VPISGSYLQAERRNQPRRKLDRDIDDLHKTYSTPYCHACLERLTDGVLLLDDELQVIFSTPQADKVMSGQNAHLVVTPKFTVHNPYYASRLTAFVDGNSGEANPLSLLFENVDENNLMLINCFRLPKPDATDLKAACYMVILRNTSYYPTHQWRLFCEQFKLTPAESRLCRTLIDGLTLNDYARKWKLTISTARSQLSSVFNKTSMRRQSDLLRLIFLFTRT